MAMKLKDNLNNYGYAVERAVLPKASLVQVDSATALMISRWLAGEVSDADFWSCHFGGVRDQTLYRIHNLEKKHPSIIQLVESPPFKELVRSVVGETALPTAFALVIKMPWSGAAVPWHRDPVNVPPMTIFNFSIYLDNSNLDNGCLEVVPSSHLLPLAIDAATERPEGAVPVPVDQGDVIVHDVRIIHGSAISCSGKCRRSIVIEYRAAHLLREL